jgi:hypothetical protein
MLSRRWSSIRIKTATVIINNLDGESESEIRVTDLDVLFQLRFRLVLVAVSYQDVLQAILHLSIRCEELTHIEVTNYCSLVVPIS